MALYKKLGFKYKEVKNNPEYIKRGKICTSDCVVTAVSLAEGIPYTAAYKMVHKLMEGMYEVELRTSMIRPFLRALGWVQHTPRKAMSTIEFLLDNKENEYLIICAPQYASTDHIFYYNNGIIYDRRDEDDAKLKHPGAHTDDMIDTCMCGVIINYYTRGKKK